jgi:lactate permease
MLTWLAAVCPILLLLTLVLLRLPVHLAAVLVVVAASIIAYVHFGARLDVLAPAIGKGAWLGLWIVYVVAPALLLYRLASVAGVDRVRMIVASLAGNGTERLLVVAWVLPSFIQGVAGFGAPIALTAPLLLGLGFDRVRAVCYPLVGYCWSVTFGSMASSYYTAVVTAHLDPAAAEELAIRASVILGILAISCGITLCLLDGGPRALIDSFAFVLVVGGAMAATLIIVARFVPTVATVAAGGAGMAVVVLLSAARRHERLPLSRFAVLAPYVALLAVTLPVFLVPASGDWARTHLLLALDFPATRTALGWANPARADYTPIALLGHPGTYILISCAVAVIAYRRYGLWQGPRLGEVLRGWASSIPRAAAPIVGLTIVAAILIDSGMTTTIARGLVDVLGSSYPLVSPTIGAVGSFITGSTTSSNALLSSLQAESAELIGRSPTTLLAAQTAGGNVGNAIAPVVIATGGVAVDAADRVSIILRRTAVPAVGLLILVTVLTVLALELWGP